jgi:hypothetical protein
MAAVQPHHARNTDDGDAYTLAQYEKMFRNAGL